MYIVHCTTDKISDDWPVPIPIMRLRVTDLGMFIGVTFLLLSSIHELSKLLYIYDWNYTNIHGYGL